MKPYQLKLPFFEIGPKAYLYGNNALRLAKRADELAQQLNIDVIFTPQTTDIYRIASETEHIKVFAQHMDSLPPGRGMGSVLPEALKAAGAYGTFLNHAERKLSLCEIQRCIDRAHEAGLAALVCANDAAEAVALAHFRPDILIVEAEDRIGKAGGYEQARSIMEVKRNVAQIDSEIQLLFGAGIRSEEDVAHCIYSGADATGCTSAIMCAENPLEKMESMLRALRAAWDETHKTRE